MDFRIKKKKIFSPGYGIYVKKGGFIDPSTLFEAGKTIGTLAYNTKQMYDAATVGKKKTNEDKFMEFLNEDDSDLDHILSKKEKDTAANVVKKMRNLVKNGKGLEYYK